MDHAAAVKQFPNFIRGIPSLKEIITERRNSSSALPEMGAAQRYDTLHWPLTSNPTPAPSGSPSHCNHQDAKPYNLENTDFINLMESTPRVE